MGDNVWEILPHYKNKVLVGNWFEERLKYNKEQHKHSTTYHTDYRPRNYLNPDINTRLTYWIRGGGLEKKHIFGHHGDAHMHNSITWYDEDFNKRERTGRNKLPAMREWDSGTLSWRPERRDFPIQGEPTNWGLRQQKARSQECARQSMQYGDSKITTYQTSYVPPSREALLSSRYAPWKARSALLHPLNTTGNTATGPKQVVVPENSGNLTAVPV